jgi:hypothetical protein
MRNTGAPTAPFSAAKSAERGCVIERDLIEIGEPADGVWAHAPPTSEAKVHEALTDPDTWIWTEGEVKRMVMLMTTDRADALLGLDVGPVVAPEATRQR